MTTRWDITPRNWKNIVFDTCEQAAFRCDVLWSVTTFLPGWTIWRRSRKRKVFWSWTMLLWRYRICASAILSINCDVYSLEEFHHQSIGLWSIQNMRLYVMNWEVQHVGRKSGRLWCSWSLPWIFCVSVIRWLRSQNWSDILIGWLLSFCRISKISVFSLWFGNVFV